MDGDSIHKHIQKRQEELRENPLPFFKRRIQDILLEDFDTLMHDYIHCANNTPWTSEDTIFLFEYFISTKPKQIREIIIEVINEDFYHTNGDAFTLDEYIRWLIMITDYYKLIYNNPETFVGKEKDIQMDFMKSIRAEMDWNY